MKTKRVEVLFEPVEYKTLEAAARIRGEPVGAVIREAVAKYVAGPRNKVRGEAFAWLRSQTFDMESEWEVVKKQIIDARIEAIEASLETD